MNILPNDPRLLDCSREELLFAAYWKKKVVAEQWEVAATMMGTRWKPETVHAVESHNAGSKDAYDFPLALLLNPNLYKLLKKMIPKPSMPGDDQDLKTALGFDPIREQQRRLFEEGRKLLDGMRGKTDSKQSSADTGSEKDTEDNTPS